MKYMVTIDTSEEISRQLMQNREAALAEMGKLMAQYKPEAQYFSILRRFSYMVVNIEDPHVELRRLFESLSKFGKITIEPISTFEEFLVWFK